MENHLIYYLETYTFSEIIAQATIFTVLVVVLHHFFEIFPCFHYQTVLITDAKVIYYIGTAIRANGDLRIQHLYEAMSKATHEEEAADDEEGHQIVMPFVSEEGWLHHIFLYSFLDTYRCKYLYGLPNIYLPV